MKINLDLDLEYICSSISKLSAIPTRLFKKNKLVKMYYDLELCTDPIKLFEEDILQASQLPAYFATPHFHYYGIIGVGDTKIVLGPTSQFNFETEDLKQLAFLLDIQDNDIDCFISTMQSIICYPLPVLSNMLCLMQYMLSGKKTNVSEMLIEEGIQERITEKLQTQIVEESLKNTFAEEDLDTKTAYLFEQKMLHYIQNGNVAELQEMFKNTTIRRQGKLSRNQTRQQKNMFVVATTLACRAAIKGGLSEKTALSLSDNYIQHAELLNDDNQLQNLQYKMVMDYAEQVAKIKDGKELSTLISKTKNCIKENLLNDMTVEELANKLNISRGNLATRFKKETGLTITDYILSEKVEMAKNLLAFSDKTLTSISYYLGFSSQSHFLNTFKKYTGTTPKKFRDNIFTSSEF